MKAIVKGFIEALLWAENDGEEPAFDSRSDVKGVAPECVKRIEDGCAAFLAKVETMNGVPLHKEGHEVYSEHGGHDLFLTARGHGAGFWDGDWTLGDQLTATAHETCGFIEHVGFFVNDSGLVEF